MRDSTAVLKGRRRFDSDTGQVYSEVIVKYQPPQQHWASRRPQDRPRYVSLTQGAHTLYTISLRRLICEAHTLQTETLARIPGPLVEKIWRAIRKEHCENFHIWRVFASTGNGDCSFVHNIGANTLYMPLVDYFHELASGGFLWVTDLTLGDINCSAIDLKQLAVLANLQNLVFTHTLTIDAGQNPFDDGLIDNMSARAMGEGAFSRLRMAFIESAPRITGQVFKYLGRFPALDTFCVTGTKIRPRHKAGVNLAWDTRSNSSFASYMEERRVRAAYNIGILGSRRFKELAEGYITFRRFRTDEDASSTLVLNARLGLAYATGARLLDEEAKCFERDWNLCPICLPSLQQRKAPPQKPDHQNSASVYKKRKIKEGKAIALHTMLDGL